MIEDLFRRDFDNISEEEGCKILEQAFTMLFSRYKMASSLVDIVILNQEGTSRRRIQVKSTFTFNGFVNKEDIL